MAFDTALADRIRIYLANIPDLEVEEKKMFGGLAFLVNGKMCVNVSGERLMCRFDPQLQQQMEAKAGYEPMIMRGKRLTGYCYVESEGFATKKEFDYWMKVCLSFNEKSKRKNKNQETRSKNQETKAKKQ